MQAQVLERNFAAYESGLIKARNQFSKIITAYLKQKNPRTLLLFWIHFSSQGIGMTELAEDWNKRAGKHCEALGFSDLGKELGKHAIYESNHHLMMIKDTHHLVDQWNRLYTPKLDSDILLKHPPSEAVIAYQDLHEQYITGKTPYCQIAIEYEIENIAAMYGARMVIHAMEVLGMGFRECLIFTDEHARADVINIKFNKKVITNFISSYPETASPLIEAGTKALKAYGNFLTDCLKRSTLSARRAWP